MKLRVFESISVDGYFTDRQGDIAWAHSGRQDPEFGAWVGSNASGAGILLFGRVTYQRMEAFWPTPAAAEQMPEVARGMNAAHKLVASRTIKPTWTNTQRIEGECHRGSACVESAGRAWHHRPWERQRRSSAW